MVITNIDYIGAPNGDEGSQDDHTIPFADDSAAVYRDCQSFMGACSKIICEAGPNLRVRAREMRTEVDNLCRSNRYDKAPKLIQGFRRELEQYGLDD